MSTIIAKVLLILLLFSQGTRGYNNGLTDIDQLDVLVVEELKRHGHVLELLGAERGPLVVLGQAFAAEHLDERDEPQPVAQVGLQVADRLARRLQVLVGPSRERVLLYELPARVLCQIPFGGSHVVLLTAVVVVVITVRRRRFVRRRRRRRHS